MASSKALSITRSDVAALPANELPIAKPIVNREICVKDNCHWHLQLQSVKLRRFVTSTCPLARVRCWRLPHHFV